MTTVPRTAPCESLRSAVSYAVNGVLVALLGVAVGGHDGLLLLGLGAIAGIPGGLCIVGRFGEEFVVEARDLKERLLGQSRSKYQR